MVTKYPYSWLICGLPDRIEAEGLKLRDYGSCPVSHLACGLKVDLQLGNYLMTVEEECLFDVLATMLQGHGVSCSKWDVRELYEVCRGIDDDDDRLMYFSMWCYKFGIFLTRKELMNDNQET